MAAGDTTKEVLWARQVMQELHRPQACTTVLLCDNEPAINMASHPVTSARSKHIDIRHHFIRENVGTHIRLRHVSTQDQEADLLTTALGKHPFRMLRDRLMGITA